uniref:Uncharacterized protein n=1 Tax=Romanomermis culicivorax TaxID=13658 RepID=A0A915IH87_ROMCU
MKNELTYKDQAMPRTSNLERQGQLSSKESRPSRVTREPQSIKITVSRVIFMDKMASRWSVTHFNFEISKFDRKSKFRMNSKPRTLTGQLETDKVRNLEHPRQICDRRSSLTSLLFCKRNSVRPVKLGNKRMAGLNSCSKHKVNSHNSRQDEKSTRIISLVHMQGFLSRLPLAFVVMKKFFISTVSTVNKCYFIGVELIDEYLKLLRSETSTDDVQAVNFQFTCDKLYQRDEIRSNVINCSTGIKRNMSLDPVFSINGWHAKGIDKNSFPDVSKAIWNFSIFIWNFSALREFFGAPHRYFRDKLIKFRIRRPQTFGVTNSVAEGMAKAQVWQAVGILAASFKYLSMQQSNISSFMAENGQDLDLDQFHSLLLVMMKELTRILNCPPERLHPF